MLKKLNKNSEQVLSARYYLRDAEGDVLEDWVKLCKRVVDNIIGGSSDKHGLKKSERKKLSTKFFKLVNNQWFLPNSPALFNAGTKNQMLSACFIIDVLDDLAEIYESVKESALIHKMGGGVGLSFGKLRAKGSLISSTHGGSSGAVSFMRAFSNATSVVTAGGRRHGANMGMLPCDHADIEEFISCKEQEGDLNNFNISVAVTDAFMQAAADDADWELKDPKDGKAVKIVRARELLEKLAEGAWRNGEPGVCFIDAVNRDNATPELGRIHSPNPCGEFYNIPYNSCTLGSINLLKFVEGKGVFNFSKFRAVVRDITFFLDCVLDVCKYPLEKISKVTLDTRPIGIGVFNFANVLIKMGLVYGEEESIKFARELAEIMSLTSLDESSNLAKTKGSYPAFNAKNHTYEKYTNSSTTRKAQWKKLTNKIKKQGLRNSHTLVIAPTGSLARIAQEGSFGIEPVFAFEYESNILDGQQLKHAHTLYSEFQSGKLKVDRKVFVTARDLSPEKHLAMQEAWQTFVHNGISKTVNLHNKTTKKEVYQIITTAWEKQLKGVTVYREGSRNTEVLVSCKSKPGRPKLEINEDVLKKLAVDEKMSIQKLSEVFDCSISTIKNRLNEHGIEAAYASEPIPRPSELYGPTVKVPTSLGSLYINIGEDKTTGKPIETVLNISKSGTSVLALTEALGKVTSKALQNHVGVKEIVKSLNGIGGDTVVWWEGKAIKSIPDAVAKVLMRYLDGADKKKIEANGGDQDLLNGNSCPSCGGDLLYQEGCFNCSLCSYSKCG